MTTPRLDDLTLENIEGAAKGNGPMGRVSPTGPFAHPADTLLLVAEVRRLQGMVEQLAARVAGQSELLSMRAEKGRGEAAAVREECARMADGAAWALSKRAEMEPDAQSAIRLALLAGAAAARTLAARIRARG